MPVSDDAGIELTGYNWVPDFARGLVRDLRVRWALEEIGLPYRMRLMHPAEPKPAEFLQEQPFGQVPSYNEGDVHLFESGAILVHVGGKDERLLPRDPNGRGRAIGWVFAALNSVEPILAEYAVLDMFHAGQEWAKLRKPSAEEALRKRLTQLSDWLNGKDWLEDSFNIGDIAMVSVLRILRGTDLISDYANLASYQARAQARPAFGAALEAQMADFTADAPKGWG